MTVEVTCDDRRMSRSVEALLDAGRAALRAGDAAGARRALERAFANSPSGEVLDGLARAAYLELDFPRAIEDWERAYAAYRSAGDQMGAIRVARTLSGISRGVPGRSGPKRAAAPQNSLATGRLPQRDRRAGLHMGGGRNVSTPRPGDRFPDLGLPDHTGTHAACRSSPPAILCS
jgi:tetratricopeptide (TPR) repeat protein